MFLPKPERIVKGKYPDEALLENLRHADFTTARIPEHEMLQFRRLQSLIYELRVAGYDVEAMQTEVFVGASLFAYVDCKVAVTRCEYDFEVNDNLIESIHKRLPPNLLWLTTNANTSNASVKPLPIGLTDYCGYSPYHSVIGDAEKFRTFMDRHQRTEDNLVLLNFKDSTNYDARAPVRSLFGEQNFVTAEAYNPDESGYERYVRGLRSHPFCLAPRGNGIDTHRMWECLYAGCIPIVQRAEALREFEELPIFFVENWEEACNPDVLTRIRDAYYQKSWDLRKLTISYWYQYVCRALGME